EDKRVSKMIASVQAQVEAMNFEIRKNVLKYDDVLNRQRHVIYSERRAVLEGEDVHDQVLGMIDDTIEGFVIGATQAGISDDWDLDGLWTELKQLYPIGVSIGQLEAKAGGRDRLTPDFLIEELQEDA